MTEEQEERLLPVTKRQYLRIVGDSEEDRPGWAELHTMAEYDELKAKLDHAQRRIEELCLWGRAGEDDRKELKAKLDLLYKDHAEMTNKKNAWVFRAKIAENQTIDLSAKVFGLWAVISGISIGFAIITLALVGVLP